MRRDYMAIKKITRPKYELDTQPLIYSYPLSELEAWFEERGHKKFRAGQLWDWLYRKRVTSFRDMSNLSKELIEQLEAYFVFPTLTEKVKQQSVDGTRKFLFELKDGLLIETVLMPQEYGLSICVTTQVGCNIGCTFCASGIIAKQRDLVAGEIVAQVLHVQRALDALGQGERVSHIVVMGIGEPFDNYDNVMKFLRVVNSDKGLGIGARHITVSTSGLAPKILEFADEGLQVNLALSLHAPDNDTRSRIMRINRQYPIEVVMAAIDEYIRKTNRRVTFEYIMLNEVNDSVEQAQQLAQLLKDKKKLSYVNLIPYNKVREHDQYERSTKERVVAFYDVLKKHHINCVVRKEFGHDIEAACGQLRSSQLKRERRKRSESNQ
ncbi:23S rRNA (adenine(2503)-C(2))-methyltransferase RlmN [Aerococcaceae bacterium NML190938]|nr:23S rRNA (adenine(2503)-C(2))-methyltransferase RlmN [Aerococcaceae bacterium NML190938]MCW6680530.1 23S rRNA (adenine(2503)-C(2))-methyltransferase RlmN [Aerococcaceae bacterium NML130460]MDO4774858.1 23S rRNA (adenine(2503)-C(2))-methyltransferase RlmN [Aerococcaceae bacterium]